MNWPLTTAHDGLERQVSGPNHERGSVDLP